MGFITEQASSKRQRRDLQANAAANHQETSFPPPALPQRLLRIPQAQKESLDQSTLTLFHFFSLPRTKLRRRGMFVEGRLEGKRKSTPDTNSFRTIPPA